MLGGTGGMRLIITAIFLVSLGACTSSTESQPAPDTTLGVDTHSAADTTRNDTTEEDSSHTPTPDTIVRTPDTSPPPPPPPGVATGRVINVYDEPLSGAFVLVCTDSYCVSGETNEDGVYTVSELDVAPHKIEVGGGEYLSIVFYQDVVAEGPSSATRDIVLIEAPAEDVPWLETEGGTVSLANDQLTLSIAPDDLSYPFGFSEEIQRVAASSVALSQLPPYDQEPWVGLESGSQAFHLAPLGLKTVGAPFTVTIQSPNATPGDYYTIWFVDPDHGTLLAGGGATAQEDGTITSDSDASLTLLSTLLVIPSKP